MICSCEELSTIVLRWANIKLERREVAEEKRGKENFLGNWKRRSERMEGKKKKKTTTTLLRARKQPFSRFEDNDETNYGWKSAEKSSSRLSRT
jgi:hypothetical protein